MAEMTHQREARAPKYRLVKSVGISRGCTSTNVRFASKADVFVTVGYKEEAGRAFYLGMSIGPKASP